jgi:hypothetical protein
MPQPGWFDTLHDFTTSVTQSNLELGWRKYCPHWLLVASIEKFMDFAQFFLYIALIVLYKRFRTYAL